MIKVLIERELQIGLEEEYQQASQALLQACRLRPGYISGESHRDLCRKNHRVIITHWKTRADWTAWAHSNERQQLLGGIAALLIDNEKVTLLEPL